ncbi:MAG: hypothetical protein GY805_20980 [Chloroflexi bacterium]|nr:hypothetical protein [Chloroflexota bacterium]
MDFLITIALFAQETEPVGVPGWIPVVIGVILLLLFWWGLSRNSIPQGSETDTDDAGHEEEVGKTAVINETTTNSVTETPTAPDNLKRIEGIGPKIEGILHEAGIFTFSDLGATSVSQLEKIVREDAGIRIAFPKTWPEQAMLAANSKWIELEKLQDDLKGGRRA